jgi:hypothetical protein
MRAQHRSLLAASIAALLPPGNRTSPKATTSGYFTSNSLKNILFNKKIY